MIRSISVAMLVGLLSAVAGADDSPPNILFIVCDDLNTHVSPSGYAPIQTPTLIPIRSKQ